MSATDPSKVTEADLKAQIEKLKEVAAKSIAPCLTAKYIAFSDRRVRDLFVKKFQDGYVFQGIECLDVLSIPEKKYVLFDFDCKPGTLCLIKPAFLVVVNMISASVEGIVDPYIPTAFGTLGEVPMSEYSCNNCRRYFPRYDKLKDWLRTARDAGHFTSEEGCKLFIGDTTTAAGIIAALLGGGIAGAVIEEALRQCGNCACEDIY
jgi:hypothetical protein